MGKYQGIHRQDHFEAMYKLVAHISLGFDLRWGSARVWCVQPRATLWLESSISFFLCTAQASFSEQSEVETLHPKLSVRHERAQGGKAGQGLACPQGDKKGVQTNPPTPRSL